MRLSSTHSEQMTPVRQHSHDRRADEEGKVVLCFFHHPKFPFLAMHRMWELWALFVSHLPGRLVIPEGHCYLSSLVYT